MQVKAEQVPTSFEPVYITLILETQGEIDGLHGFFNNAHVCTFAESAGFNPTKIRASLSKYRNNGGSDRAWDRVRDEINRLRQGQMNA